MQNNLLKLLITAMWMFLGTALVHAQADPTYKIVGIKNREVKGTDGSYRFRLHLVDIQTKKSLVLKSYLRLRQIDLLWLDNDCVFAGDTVTLFIAPYCLHDEFHGIRRGNTQYDFYLRNACPPSLMGCGEPRLLPKDKRRPLEKESDDYYMLRLGEVNRELVRVEVLELKRHAKYNPHRCCMKAI